MRYIKIQYWRRLSNYSLNKIMLKAAFNRKERPYLSRDNITSQLSLIIQYFTVLKIHIVTKLNSGLNYP